MSSVHPRIYAYEKYCYDSNQILLILIKTNNYWVVPKCASQIQDGGRKIATVHLSNGLADFDDLYVMRRLSTLGWFIIWAMTLIF